MKKISLIAAVSIIILPLLVNAQPEKGKLLFEGAMGNITYSAIKSESPLSSPYINEKGYDATAGISSGIGYFLINRFCVGIMLDLNYQSSKHSSDWEAYNTLAYTSRRTGFYYGGTPYFRYYFAGKNANRFYGELHAGIGDGKTTQSQTTYTQYGGNPNPQTTVESRTRDLRYGAMLGFSHFFTPNVAFSTSIGADRIRNSYTTYYVNYGSPYTMTNEQTGIHLSWKLGFSILLPVKKKAESPAAK